MVDNYEETRIKIDKFDFAQQGASIDATRLVNDLASKLEQALVNPSCKIKFSSNFTYVELFNLHKKRVCMRNLIKRLPKEDTLVSKMMKPHEMRENILKKIYYDQ